MFFKNRNIIILSSVDWKIHRQLHHELVDYFLKNNNRVLYIENTGSRNFTLSDIPRISQRIKNFFKSIGGFKIINKKLTIFSPLFIPFHGFFIFDKINSFYIGNKILNWISLYSFSNPVVISFIPNPLSYSVSRKIKHSLLAYYMADEMNLSNNKFMAEIERKIIKISDIVICTSTELKKKINYSKNNYLLINGVNSKFFKKLKKKHNKQFIVGFVGSIRSAIDQELIIKLALQFPKFKFVFVGPVFHKPELILKKKIKNINFIGHVNHSQIPNIIKNFSVGIIPFNVNKFTDSIFPLKLFEYMASGVPIITTATKTLQKFENENKKSIYIANNHNDFAKKLKDINNGNFSKKIIKKNIDLARDNVWEKKFNKLDNIFNYHYLKNKNKKIYFKEKIIKLYNINKIRVVKYISSIFILLFSLTIFFQSKTFDNFFYVSNKNLYYKNAIIVTGHGYRDYNNISYLERSKEFEFYNKLINFNKIIIIGRISIYNEGELTLDLILKNKSINRSDVYLINDSGSLYQNIQELKKLLKKEVFKNTKNFSVIIEKSSSKRFNLTSKKNIPDLKIDFLSPLKINNSYLMFIYEFFALIKYKIKNYL